MQTSERELMREAKETGFRPEIMEKVWLLMAILDGISVHPFLKTLATDDLNLIEKINIHPLLQWKAKLVLENRQK